MKRKKKKIIFTWLKHAAHTLNMTQPTNTRPRIPNISKSGKYVKNHPLACVLCVRSVELIYMTFTNQSNHRCWFFFWCFFSCGSLCSETLVIQIPRWQIRSNAYEICMKEKSREHENESEWKTSIFNSDRLSKNMPRFKTKAKRNTREMFVCSSCGELLIKILENTRKG